MFLYSLVRRIDAFFALAFVNQLPHMFGLKNSKLLAYR